MGRGVNIKMPEGTTAIEIKYRTLPSASALSWSDTFLSSQCEAILARSILPCQDSPSRKSTYKAKVRVVDRKFSVLMSALRTKVSGNTFSFNQPQPIPTYLLAIAIGEFYSAKISSQSTVYAMSQELADKSAKEFD